MIFLRCCERKACPAKSRYSYVMPCEEFEEHCRLFARLRGVESEGVLQPEITFDDGNVSDVEYAVPALARHGLTATFFITAGWTGQRSGFMNWPQVRELQGSGQHIGAHGMTHKLLTACSDVELQRELRGAKELLEDRLGAEVSVMSLPGGRANGRVLQACGEAGYRQIFTSAPKAEFMEEGPRTVGRLNLLAGVSVAWLEQVLRPETGALAKLQRSHQAKTAAKLVLGDRLYAKLWALANREETPATEAEALVP
jgi:hypothetical protein